MAQEGGKRTPSCVLCGCCLEGCPLMAATGREELSPRAKALLAGPSKIAVGQGLDETAVAELAGLCLACGRCEALCPQGVSVPKLVAELRAAHPDFRQWLWKQWITRLRPFWPLAARGAGLIPESAAQALLPRGFSLALKGLRGIAPGTGLRPWLRLTHMPVEALRERTGGRPVALFDGCVGSGPRAGWAATARMVLKSLGATPVPLDFSCCGSTLGVAGLPAAQKTARLANVAAWRGAGRPLVLTYCATCHKGLAEYSADVFEDAAEAGLWAASLVPLSALLMGARGKVERGAPRLVTWHQPCHGAGSGKQADPDLELARSLLGSRLRVPRRSRCCGFGGIMQLGAPELSGRVGAQCWAGLAEVAGGAEVAQVTPPSVLTGCSGCVMQLSALAPQGAQVGHWLEIVRMG